MPSALIGGIISQGTIVVPNTWEFNLDTGTLGGGDIWWEDLTTASDPDLQFTPLGTAQLVNLCECHFIAGYSRSTPKE